VTKLHRLLSCCLLTFLLIWPPHLRAQTEEAEVGPPLTPQQFHEQELSRLRSVLSEPRVAGVMTTQDDFDAVFYDLTLDLRSYSTRTIRGNLTLVARSRAAALDEIILDLCTALTVDSTFCNGSLRRHTSADTLLTISLDTTYAPGEMVTVRVVYHGIPCLTNPPYPSFLFGRSNGTTTVPAIATTSEPKGARDWWPCKNVPSDKADSMRISIIVADTVTATSNGVLDTVITVPPSSRKFVWFEHHPISTYLVSVNATNYTRFEDWYVRADGDSIPIVHYAFPERLARAQTGWSNLPAMMGFCEEKFGPYPFADEKYGHTMVNYYLAMENQCNTSFGRLLTNGEDTYDYIQVHELAHQWYGDDVTLANWSDIWLNEGFGAYAEALWQEHVGGAAAYHTYMNSVNNLGVTDPSGPVVNPTDLLSTNSVYNKGAWILHMLRGLIDNDSLFYAALREYHSNHAHGNAATPDFLTDVSAVAGFDVTPYLHPYLYLTDRPHYTYSFGSGYASGYRQTVVRISQAVISPWVVFPNRFDLLLFDGIDSTRTRVEIHDWDARYYIRPDFDPTQVTLDPDNWVLKQTITEELPLTVLSDTLRAARVDVPYNDTLTAIGGSGEIYTWSLGEGTVPPGLVLSDNGVLSGTPIVGGDFSFQVRVTDDAFAGDKTWVNLHVRPALTRPTNVTALLNEDTGLLRLRWSSVADADSYRVYRAARADAAQFECLLTTADTVAWDSIAPNEADSTVWVQRYYHVTAMGVP
jgi:aminopeptidase N